jgi:hypothetical protein
MPVRVVIALFSALKTMNIVLAIVVLARLQSGGSRSHALISGEQAVVARTLGASAEIRVGFVHAILVGLKTGRRVRSHIVHCGLSDCRCRKSVANKRMTKILENKIAIDIGMSNTASMLNSKLDLQKRTFVKGHRWTPTVAAFIVVLRVVQPVWVIGVGRSFSVAIVGTPAEESCSNN